MQWDEQISIEEYRRLRRRVGWFDMEEGQAGRCLAGSWAVVCARAAGAAVGVARVIGDGGYMALIADVMVDPDWQGRGVGRGLMERALARIQDQLSPGQPVMGNLMSVPGREGFYEQLGFVRRPNEHDGAGLALWLGRP